MLCVHSSGGFSLDVLPTAVGLSIHRIRICVIQCFRQRVLGFTIAALHTLAVFFAMIVCQDLWSCDVIPFLRTVVFYECVLGFEKCDNYVSVHLPRRTLPVAVIDPFLIASKTQLKNAPLSCPTKTLSRYCKVTFSPGQLSSNGRQLLRSKR